MLIVSKIERAGGTVVTLDGTRYHFQPTAKIPKHVAEVEDADHIQRFLSIREGFAPFSEKEARAAAPAPAPQPTPEPTPEQRLEQTIEPGAVLPDDDAQATDTDKSDAATGEQKKPEPEATDSDDGLEQMDDLTLGHAYHDAIGKKPTANMKRETMIARIRAANAA